MKTISYGTMHFIVAFGVSYTMTGSLAIASGIAMVEPLVQTFAYSFHEKIWKRIEYRKQLVNLPIDHPVGIPNSRNNIKPLLY